MTVSTKGRYALRVMTELAEQVTDNYIPLKLIAERQNISLKYIEGIMASLSRAGLTEGQHGKGGGYRLCRKPEEYKVSEILAVTEGTLAPVACLAENAVPCEMADCCRTLPMWKALNDTIIGFFESYTLAELMKKE